jgi:hypothetical protein
MEIAVVGFIGSGKTVRGLREYPTLCKERKGWGTRLSGRLNFLSQEFRGEEVAHGFAAADELGAGAGDQDFGGAGAGVVVGGLGHAVGSGVEEEDEVVWFYGWEGAVAGEEVA